MDDIQRNEKAEVIKNGDEVVVVDDTSSLYLKNGAIYIANLAEDGDLLLTFRGTTYDYRSSRFRLSKRAKLRRLLCSKKEIG